MRRTSIVGLLNFEQMKNTVRRLYGRENDFTWGLPDRTLWWKDYVVDQEEARAAEGW
jgi:hypothetical protein